MKYLWLIYMLISCSVYRNILNGSAVLNKLDFFIDVYVKGIELLLSNDKGS